MADSKKDKKDKKGEKKPKTIFEEFGFKQEVSEENKDQFIKTEFPLPMKRYRVVIEKYNQSVEEVYYWIYSHVNEFLGYPEVFKLVDTFAASENSAFFGVSQQRLSIQQDKVSQFLATIGKMVKELFQIVRELRIIEERLNMYRGSKGLVKSTKFVEEEEESEKGQNRGDDITLKGIWIDLVQGGAKNPASVYGMAREVQFLSLPDLFFSTYVNDPNMVEEVVEKQRSGFNKAVRNVLIRQLVQYLTWRDSTFKELKNRQSFTLKYLRQHYDIIKMYITWVKPYLKNIQRLSLSDKNMMDPHLVSAFETSMIEIEILGTKKPVDIKGKTTFDNPNLKSCISVHFKFRTRPAMSFQQEYAHKGPIHVGRIDIDMRAYAWTTKEIDNYKKMKDKMDLELLNSISESVREAMEYLGDDLKRYLEEAGENFDKKEKEKKEEEKNKPPSLWEEFKAEWGIVKKDKKDDKAAEDEKPSEKDLDTAQKAAKGDTFLLFKNFKKAQGLIMW